MQKIIRIDEAKESIFDNLKEQCYVLNAGLNEAFCKRFLEKANETEKIVLFYGEKAVDVCKSYDGDGVILDFGAEKLKEKMQDLRKNLGKNKYVGLFTRNRKHESMLVSEVEPDFIIFKVWKDGFLGVKELIDWYQEFFIIQSAAWIMEDGVEVGALQADFIIEGA